MYWAIVSDLQYIEFLSSLFCGHGCL